MNTLTEAFSFITTSVGLTSSSSSSSSSSESKCPFLKLDTLNAKQLQALEEMYQSFPNASKEELIGYLKVRDFKVKEASAQYQTSLLWKESNMQGTSTLHQHHLHHHYYHYQVDISDVAPFILTPPGCDGCDGGVYCLEDMKGDCARDVHGRPIVYIQGMLYGSIDEMVKQMVYCMKRASLYQPAGFMKCSTVILNATPSNGCNKTFRFPDAESKQLMKYQTIHFPGTLSSTTHICGIPSYIVWAFTLCKPFMDQEAYNNMLVKPDFSHLISQNYVTKENLPKVCGGDLDFNVKAYVEWRAQEEGIEINYNNIRRYETKDAVQISELDMKSSLMQTTSLQLNSGELKATKIGILKKQGSGKGFFANMKWKEKYVSVGPGGLCYYFDSPDISNTNKVSAVIALNGAYIELLDSDVEHSFQLVTSERNYIFSAKSEDDRIDWIKAFNEQFSVSDLTIDYRQKQQQQQQQQGEEEKQHQ